MKTGRRSIGMVRAGAEVARTGKRQGKGFNRAFFLLYFWMSICAFQVSAGAESPSKTGIEDTLLVFVGEDLEVLSIASRREESARKAPAIATAISREQIKSAGSKTLGDVLALVPGFYMASKEWGTLPFLRGIPNSILFLYDTVPTGSDVTKSMNGLDNEISLAAVKRIEVVRGPGSVLWGPDAFAGIVNLTPLTGKDLQGVETGVIYGIQGEQKEGYVNWGHDAGVWNGFASVSARRGDAEGDTANLVRFWGENGSPVAVDHRYGSATPGESQFIDVYGNFSLPDRLSLTGKISENERPYSISDAQQDDLTWIEAREAKSGFLKMETKKEIDVFSAVRLTGFYSWLHPEYSVIDQKKVSYKERMKYAELIYDREMMSGKGLLTGGVSYREKDIHDAPVWDDYLPDFLGPENNSFLPNIIYRDYRTELWSLFAQYNQKLGSLNLAAGFRQDMHDEYTDHLSLNTSAVWTPSSHWVLKLLYGTAYRTPFARQLLQEETPDLEEIQSVNAQVVWNPVTFWSISTTLFFNHIENHVMEDPYAGLSEPNRQDIRGVEFELRFEPSKMLALSANMTLTDNRGPNETYRYNDFDFIRPDGTVVPHYVDLAYPYDSGPDALANLTATWRPSQHFAFFSRIGYSGSKKLIFPRGESTLTTSEVWLADLCVTVKDLIGPGWTLSVLAKNLLDHDYKIPGTYSLIGGAPFRSEIVLEKRW